MEHDTFDINIKGSGFNIATMLITGFMFGISISNSVYFSRISAVPNYAMGKTTARAMMALNIVLAILSGIIFVWSSYKLLVSNEDKFGTMSKYVESARDRMNNIRKNTHASMKELNTIDSSGDEMHHYGHSIFDNPTTSDTEFSDF